MKKEFGIFILNKRLEHNYTLREFSRMIGISPEYLSKIENGLRSAPNEDVLNKISNKLVLDVEEKEQLYDLAAQSKPNLSLASDLIEYIQENEMLHKVLRITKRYKLSNKEWKEIFNYIKNFYL
ncbi:MAG: helix-turn-helix transcriptional regulator [Clostridia bacterium]|nr:helix-turn-helix transcriptional regulator [Clostridia bacterium]